MEAFGPMPTLETARLVLRPLQREDAPAIFAAYAQDPEVARYTMWAPHASIADTHAFLDLELARYAQGEPGSFAFVRRDDGRLVGAGGFVNWVRAHKRTEIGYVLARSEWGQGLAPEAGEAIVQLAFARGARRVEAFIKEPNRASQRVVEKLGFALEGQMRDYKWAHGRSWDYRLYARFAP